VQSESKKIYVDISQNTCENTHIFLLSRRTRQFSKEVAKSYSALDRA
jgi:DNA primase